MLDEEFEDQKELQEDDQTAEQQFNEFNITFDRMYELGKALAPSGVGELFDFKKRK